MNTSQARERSLPRQRSLRRLREFAINPNRELGQHFLIDDNILAVIEKAAGLASDDVVLEVGGGLGTLSEYLAPRVRYLHVVEVDRRLGPALESAVGGFANARVILADAVDCKLDSLRPHPSKLVSNLPYGVAATVILKALRELGALELICVMVQREVADRLLARPRSKSYGAVSVLCQVACEGLAKRAISRNVFYPVPNVDSALVVMRRHGPLPPELTQLVNAAFAHRRKPMARSVALCGLAESETLRAQLVAIGHPATARAEELEPYEFADLAKRLDASVTHSDER